MSLVRAAASLAAFIFVVSDAQAQSRVGPSFDCDVVELEAELAVCESRRLSQLDVRMADLYRAAGETTESFTERWRLRWEQRKWLRRRNACENNRRCLRGVYEDRITALEAVVGPEDQYADRTDGPSFDCRSARRAAEQRICNSERLSRLDREMDTFYRQAIDDARTRRQRRRLKADQDRWLADRDSCRRDRRCIRRAYENRIAELQDLRLPEYQRTADWRDTCRGNVGLTMQTVCNREPLWQLHLDAEQAYKSALDNAPRRRIRRRIRDDHDEWQSSLRQCRDRRSCIRRSYRQHIAALRDSAQGRSVEADYQRTSEWRQTCRNVGHAAGRTTCGNQELWELNREMGRVYDKALAWADDAGVRNYVVRDHTQWNASWRSCGSNVRCQRRAYRDRIAELQDKAYRSKYRRSARSSKAGFQGGNEWAQFCNGAKWPWQRTTCDDEELWRLHAEMMRGYQYLLGTAPSAKRRQDYTRSQSTWEDGRFRSCGESYGCLRDAFRDRIKAFRKSGYVGH